MGRGTNQIATIGNLQEDFGAFSSSTTPNLCPTYAEIIAEGLIVSTTLSNNRLVKYSLISAAVTPPSDTITVYITNLQEITEYYGSNGLDGYTYFRWSDGSTIDDDELTYNLYCFNGNYRNTVTGTLSQWENFYNSISGTDECYLWNADADIIAGPLYDEDCDRLWAAIQEAVSNGDSECDFEFPFDLTEPAVRPATVSFASSGGSEVVTLKNGVLTSCSETLSWITLSGTSTGSTSVTITASENTTTSSRSGYVYIYVNGTSCPVYVYQSGQSTTVANVTIPVSYSLDGWVGEGTELDISLNVVGYNSSTGETKTVGDARIYAGYDGETDNTTFLGNLVIPENELSNWEIRVWGNYYSSSNGWANICFWDSETANFRYAACSDLDLAGWHGASTAPALSAPLALIEDYGGSIDILFWADEWGTGWNNDQSGIIQGSGGGNVSTPTVSVAPAHHGGWEFSSKSSISGYRCYQSSNSYNVNNGLDIMRINISGMAGYTFTIYIRSYAETTWDYTAAGVLDTALSTTNDTTNYPKGSSATMPSTIKAWTKGNQQSGTALSNYTAVTYSIPDNFPHFIDVAYVKDGSGNNGDDRGYVLIPTTYLS